MLKGFERNELGYATLSPNRPLVGGELNTWIIEYTCGRVGIKEGGAIRLSLPRTWSEFQVENPKIVGYTTISTTGRAKLNFSIGYSANPCAFQYLYIKVAKGYLVEGDKIKIVYGDTSEGGIGSVCQSYPQEYFENDEKWWGSPSLYFLISVDPEGTGQYQTIGDGHRWIGKILSGRPIELMPIAPSVVKIGETFELNVVPLDRFGYDTYFPEGENLKLKNLDLKNVKVVKFSNKVHIIKNIKFEKKGCYHIEVESKTGLVGRSNPVLVQEDSEWRVYWGDIHIHSSLDDGRKDPADIYEYCRDVLKLDFASVSNHDWGPGINTEEKWRSFKEVTNKYNKPGEFVTLIGYEWTNWEEDGNRNVYFLDDDPPIFRYNDKPSFTEKNKDNTKYILYKTANQLWKALEGIKAIVIPHHPLACMSYNFNETLEPVIEIYSCWGNSESENDPLWTTPDNKRKSGQFWKGGLSIREILRKGYKLGFVCGSDNHGGMPGGGHYKSPYLNLQYHRGGLTAVLAKELTRKSIFEAIKNRKCYGTTGDRIFLDFKINGHQMGEEICVKPESSLNINVLIVGSDRIEKIDLIKNSYIVHSQKGKSFYEKVEFYDRARKEEGTDFYYVKVLQKNGEIAWASPIWITVK